jgi:ATP adenylyltransferase
MEYIWTPWRSYYMQAKKVVSECIFCFAAQHPLEDKRTLVVFRARTCFVILNRYPYTSGHLMIVPYEHVAKLQMATEEASAEMMSLARHAERVLESIYKPDGLNLGMNLGGAAGAGIEQHLHLHVLPRWSGDVNFITAISDTRIIPEALEDTYCKVKQTFAELVGSPAAQ